MAKNKYKELYEYCQNFEPKISRRVIQAKALELTGIPRISVVKSGLDTDVCRGLFLSSSNTQARIVQQHGTDVIILARSLNYCWERFVYTKELMHVFDGAEESTSSPQQFETLLSELDPSSSLGRSPQSISEVKGLWMALACLCPEEHRKEFASQRKKGHLDDYGIALRLRIPQQYVQNLFVPSYSDIVQTLID